MSTVVLLSIIFIKFSKTLSNADRHYRPRTDLTYNNIDDDEDDPDVHYPCDNCKSDSCLLECVRCYKWLCVKCQKVPKAMINALNKYGHLHWYCMSCEVAATKAAAWSNKTGWKIKSAKAVQT